MTDTNTTYPSTLDEVAERLVALATDTPVADIYDVIWDDDTIQEMAISAIGMSSCSQIKGWTWHAQCVVRDIASAAAIDIASRVLIQLATDDSPPTSTTTPALPSDIITLDDGDRVHVIMTECPSADTGTAQITITDPAGYHIETGRIDMPSGGRWDYTASHGSHVLPLDEDDMQQVLDTITDMSHVHHMPSADSTPDDSHCQTCGDDLWGTPTGGFSCRVCDVADAVLAVIHPTNHDSYCAIVGTTSYDQSDADEGIELVATYPPHLQDTMHTAPASDYKVYEVRQVLDIHPDSTQAANYRHCYDYVL